MEDAAWPLHGHRENVEEAIGSGEGTSQGQEALKVS